MFDNKIEHMIGKINFVKKLINLFDNKMEHMIVSIIDYVIYIIMILPVIYIRLY